MASYYVIKSLDKDKFFKEVSMALRDGWKTAGGVFVMKFSTFDNEYFQALVKPGMQGGDVPETVPSPVGGEDVPAPVGGKKRSHKRSHRRSHKRSYRK